MKIILLRGNDIQKLSVRLTKFVDSATSRGWKIVRLDVSDSSLNLADNLSRQPLFNEERLLIFENINRIDKPRALWLKNNYKNIDGTAVFITEAPLNKSLQNNLPKFDKTEVFEIPKKLWTFLDSIYPGNQLIAIVLLHEVLEKEPPELVLALLARHLKDLYLAKFYPGVFEIPPWRMKKLSIQASNFTKAALQKLMNNLAKGDFEAKTGQASLESVLDLAILTNLE